MSNFSVADQSKEIRTYFSVSEPLDPARVLTMEDTEMSYALATTLVDWDDSKQIISRLASRWNVGEKTLEFKLSDKARWSDGQPITSEQVKQSFERARKKYGADLKSFFDSVTAIKSLDAKTLMLELSVANSAPAVLKKLTEPMYGIVRVLNHEQADLTTTSGPYYLSTHTAQETVLKRNPYWVHFDSGMAERIVLRKSAPGVNAQSLLISDSWPNLVATHSLMGESLLASLKQRGLIFWERNLDRTFLLTSMNGRLKEEELFQLFRFLQKNIDRSEISRGLTGYTPADQLFPRGSSMYVENLKCKDFSSEIPSSLRGKKLNVLISPERVAPEIRDNFARAVKKATGIEPEFTEVPLNQLSLAVKAKHHDFYLGSVGVADPNYEGALSFFFETTPPIIASGTGEQNLAQRTIQVRKEKDEFKRISAARSMLQDAVCYGHFVPLFQYSTTVIAKPDLDLSKIPSTDESVSFSKVRFK